MLNTAVRAARQSARIILMHYDRLDRIEVTQKGRNDFVSQADTEAEEIALEILLKAYPEHGVVAEESGRREGGEYTWVIDPLDGTTNFIHGFPQFAVSIAVLKGSTIEHGVIYDPLRNELFTSSRGQGAQLNDRRIRVSNCGLLELALLGTGFPFRELDRLDQWVKAFRTLTRRSAGIRRTGSAALDLAYVAAGRMDGFWEFGLQPWDMAAGALLIREAGGLISDPAGSQDFLDSGNVVTANPRIFNDLLRIIAKHHN
ncbi:MAG TPA: inositol monophosphatase family protein [Arenicellales bacterium]|jgi:myo-inositol-1(or 4)-monophosphatase|nr:inositol monophosphatase family protein [Arenicellales bacterium]HJP08393.1 inositol monophosphatase family protein [Arenicellales bacterium]|tara:strand:+ start:6019 stop:6792 length:774 start_codon:yes stop_codon:yes gene_type:complete